MKKFILIAVLLWAIIEMGIELTQSELDVVDVQFRTIEEKMAMLHNWL